MAADNITATANRLNFNQSTSSADNISLSAQADIHHNQATTIANNKLSLKIQVPSTTKMACCRLITQVLTPKIYKMAASSKLMCLPLSNKQTIRTLIMTNYLPIA